jgi:hypothetical protein
MNCVCCSPTGSGRTRSSAEQQQSVGNTRAVTVAEARGNPVMLRPGAAASVGKRSEVNRSTLTSRQKPKQTRGSDDQ